MKVIDTLEIAKMHVVDKTRERLARILDPVLQNEIKSNTHKVRVRKIDLEYKKGISNDVLSALPWHILE